MRLTKNAATLAVMPSSRARVSTLLTAWCSRHSLPHMTMEQRNYTHEEQAGLAAAVGADPGSDVVAAPFSPGPWWGFNGIQDLVLFGGSLHVVQSGVAVTRGRRRQSTPFHALDRTRWRTRRGLPGGRVVRLSMRADGRRRTYTSKYHEAVGFSEHLMREVSTPGGGTAVKGW